MGNDSNRELPTHSPPAGEPTQLTVQSFGGLRAWAGRTELHAPRVRAARLFNFLLAIRSHEAPKEVIAESLWPGDANGRNNLRAALHDCRLWLGDRFLIDSEHTVLRLLVYSLDADDLEAKVTTARHMRDEAFALAEYRQAVALYKGPFLPNENDVDWIRRRRDELDSLFIESALAVANNELRSYQFTAAVEVATRVCRIDEAREDAVRIQMRALAGMGLRAAALRRYARLDAYLVRELSCTPDPATRALRYALADSTIGVRPQSGAESPVMASDMMGHA